MVTNQTNPIQSNAKDGSPEGCLTVPENMAWPVESWCDCCRCWHSPAVEPCPGLALIANATHIHTYICIGEFVEEYWEENKVTKYLLNQFSSFI